MNQRPRHGETVELEFELRDERCFFVAASDRANCTLVGEKAIHRTDGDVLEFFSVRGARPETILDVTDDQKTVREARIVHEYSDSTLMAFVIAGPCVAATLADTDAVIRRATGTNGRGRVVADVPWHGDVRQVVDRFLENHPDSELLSKRTLGETIPELSNRAQNAHLTSDLTEKQRTAIEVATQNGYLSWPRRSTAADCATALDVSQSTFSQHLWTGLEKVLTNLFDPDETEMDESARPNP